MSNNGHGDDRPAVQLVRHLAQGAAKDHLLRSIVRAAGNVFRGCARNQVDLAIAKVLQCEKELHGLTEHDLFEALIIVFQPQRPIVYPDDFQPVLIFAPDGKILWQEPSNEQPAPALPPPAARVQD